MKMIKKDKGEFMSKNEKKQSYKERKKRCERRSLKRIYC